MWNIFKLTIKNTRTRSGVFIVNFGHICNIFLVFLLLNLNLYLFVCEWWQCFFANLHCVVSPSLYYHSLSWFQVKVCFFCCKPFKRQSHKMVKHTQTIRRLLPTNCLIVFDDFVGLALKVLKFCLIFEDSSGVSTLKVLKVCFEFY